MAEKLFIIDVDGTMTDGSIYYDNIGNEIKKFNTRDAAAFFVIHSDLSKIMVLTGRKCEATEKRMKELKVDYLYQNVKNKKAFLKEFIRDNQLVKENVIYIGDDLNDFYAMKLAGYICCPNDACQEIRQIADYISCKNGGDGAVRDIVEYFYRTKEKSWEELISMIYDSEVIGI